MLPVIAGNPPADGAQPSGMNGMIVTVPMNEATKPRARRVDCDFVRGCGHYVLLSWVVGQFPVTALIRTYRDLNKAPGHLTHMRSPEAERSALSESCGFGRLDQ